MADKIQVVAAVETLSPAPAGPAFANPAIARCVGAWNNALGAGLQPGEAFRAALPPLIGRDHCRDFIACVAHGILLGAIDHKIAGKLLYAAQVAIVACSVDEKAQRFAGIAAYADLTESEARHVKKFLPQRSKVL